MGRHCFVPGCKSGYRSCPEQISLFTPPRDPVLLERWRKAIPRKDRVLGPKDQVCAKHFEPHEVITEWKAVDKQGNVIQQGKRRPKVQSSAVPSIFPWCSESDYLPVKVPKNKPNDCNGSADTDMGNCPKRESDSDSYGQQEADGLELVFPDTESTIPTICMYQPNLSALTFEYLRAKIKSVALPGESWAASATNEFVAFMDVKLNRSSSCIVVTKQVLFVKNTGCKVSVLNREVPLEMFDIYTELQSIESLEHVLQLLHRRTMCPGASCSTEINNFHLDIAETDELDIWRHKQCALLCDAEITQCRACGMLDEIFQVHILRQQELMTVAWSHVTVKKEPEDSWSEM